MLTIAVSVRSTGHKGKFGHEFLEFEFRPDGKLRYANNSNYKNDSMIRKEGDIFSRTPRLWFLLSCDDVEYYTVDSSLTKLFLRVLPTVFLNQGVLDELKRMCKDCEIMK